MAIPKYNEMYVDYLEALADGQPHKNAEIRATVAAARNLTPEDLALTIPSGRVGLFMDRLSWSGQFLMKAGLTQRTGRGIYAITNEGARVLREHRDELDNLFLRRYPSFVAWENSSAPATASSSDDKTQEPSNTTHEEAIDAAFQELDAALADRLMEEIMDHDAAFFERMVVQLLLKMGYSRTNDGHVTPLSGDGGIDGVISEDRLGLSRLYLQAKRWEPSQRVGRPEIQKFSGALRDVGGTKGLFITTAHFTKEAQESAQRQNIVLVDGTQLTKLMIEYGLGVSTVATYDIKRLDSDFFSEDD